DLLDYLQNAHQWHFTAATLRAVLARAELHVEHGDESIWCLARRGGVDSSARACDGERVEAEIVELERKFTGGRKLVEVYRWRRRDQLHPVWRSSRPAARRRAFRARTCGCWRAGR